MPSCASACEVCLYTTHSRVAACCPGTLCVGGKYADEVVTLSDEQQRQLGTREAAVVRLQALARGYIVRWRMKRFRKHSSKMPPRAFRFVLYYLLVAKAVLICALLLAAMDAFTAKLPPPTSETAAHKTPFQRHPHDFGMFYQLLVTAHGITGFGLCISMMFPIFATKGSRLHVYGGRVFLGFWIAHAFNGVVNASTVVLTRGFHEENYPKDGFSMWLFIQFSFIADTVCDFLIHGLANLQYKITIDRKTRSILLTSAMVSMVHAVLFIFLGIFILVKGNASPDAEEYAIIFVVECPPYLYLLWKNWQHWKDEDLNRRLNQWAVAHARNFAFCANLTLITGLANLTFRIAPSATVTLWATQEIVIMWYVWRTNKAMRRRLALAWYQGRWAARARRQKGGGGGMSDIVLAEGRRASTGGAAAERRASAGKNTRKVAPAVEAAPLPTPPPTLNEDVTSTGVDMSAPPSFQYGGEQLESAEAGNGEYGYAAKGYAAGDAAAYDDAAAGGAYAAVGGAYAADNTGYADESTAYEGDGAAYTANEAAESYAVGEGYDYAGYEGGADYGEGAYAGDTAAAGAALPTVATGDSEQIANALRDLEQVAEGHTRKASVANGAAP